MIPTDNLADVQFEAFDRLSRFINDTPDAISAALVAELQGQLHCTAKYAYTLLLAAAIGLDTNNNPLHRQIFHFVLEPALHQLNPKDYQRNSYYSSIKFENTNYRQWQLRNLGYKPFEAFVCDDIAVNADGLQIPQIGFFISPFHYPAVLQDGRIWMTVTPNEVETMKEPVEKARGNVLTYGLGLGYYAYMVSNKNEVRSVTIVEKDRDIIELFAEKILPQFPAKAKIKIINDDAFAHAANHLANDDFDFVFTDLWHDVSDGLPLYLKMKEYEPSAPNTKFEYWIEKSIKCYL